MSIRLKIILVVLPLIVAAAVLVGVTSYFVAASAVTNVATQFLSFKASELEKYADGQWSLLAENGLVGRADMEEAAHAAVESFARSIIGSPTEAIFAIDQDGGIVMSALGSSSRPPEPSSAEKAKLASLASRRFSGFMTISLGSTPRVVQAFPFRPFAWELLVTEERDAFYGKVESIARTSLEILLAACVAAVLLLVFFTRYLTRPLEEVVAAMKRIITSNDLSERVPVEYNDEIGQLSHTFNMMLEELGKAYDQIKRFAFDAVVAQKRETKIRNIFQLYVPKDVIEEYFQNPEQMLVGDSRVVSILFSDIRNFTTISERMSPDSLVSSLNRYFAAMVDVIMERGGLVDKYIGDAIMAVFGAPARHENDALRSVYAGLEMIEALKVFNAAQRAEGGPEFPIGIGINYGVVTVGNIGCEKKMNYTVIGDMVNLASRLEGLTKKYRQPILISESVAMKISDALPLRQVDMVAVKGKTKGVKIFTVRRRLSDPEAGIWKLHEEGIARYYGRDFARAAEIFGQILSHDGDDEPAALYLERSREKQRNPPPRDWDGVEVLTEK
jgi:class 3 adenylate cyclase/HAMP domain-containing protein